MIRKAGRGRRSVLVTSEGGKRPANSSRNGTAGKNGSFQPIDGFEIMERLGSGGMGTVYRARQISMDRIVALKILKKSDLKDALPLERLRREALLVASMDHPNIVMVIDLADTPRYYYFVMEYVEGKSVQTIIDRHGPLAESRAALIIRDMAEALDHAFQREIIHRDIKPGNIIVGTDGSARLADLGLAKGIMNLSITREGTTVGTPKYMSPEQARDAASADIRSDIYSLGATFYHMVTGQPPIEGETVAQVITNVLFGKTPPPDRINPEVSRISSRVIARMMARNPARRYQTPRELLDDLGVLVEALRDRTERLSDFVGLSWRESQRVRSRFRTVLFLAVPVLFLAATAVWHLADRDDGKTAASAREKSSIFGKLEAAYAAGEISPAEALKRLPELLASSSGESAVSDAGAFRTMVLSDCRTVVRDTVRTDSPRINRILRSEGFEDACGAVKAAMAGEVCRALGCGEEEVPPDIRSFLDERNDDVSTVVRDLVSRTRSALLKRAFELLDGEAKEMRALLAAGGFVEAEERIGAVEEGKRDLASDAVVETIPLLLGKGDPEKPVDPDPRRFLEESVIHAFLDKQNLLFFDLRGDLEAAAREASQRYQEALTDSVRKSVDEADLASARKGIGFLMEEAIAAKDDLRPLLPEGLSTLMPDPGGIAAALQPRFDERLKEMEDEFRENEKTRVLLAVEGPMRLGDGVAALDLLESELAKKPPFPVPGFLDAWRRRIETVAKIDGMALEALMKHLSHDLILETRKGVTYQGELLSADPSSRVLVLKGPLDRSLRLSFKDLTVNEVLRWARKSFKLSTEETFLYLFYAGEMAEARSLLGAIDDFDGKPFFQRRILSISRVYAEEEERADNEYLAILETGNRALQAGDAEGVKRVLDELKTNEERFAKGSAWPRTRYAREKLAEGLEAIRTRMKTMERLSESFSVPVESLDGSRIRVKYPFDDPAELGDFKVRGRGFELDEGVLLFSADKGNGEPAPFESRVGVRFASGFDPREALSISFSYEAPLLGEGPCFLLFSFFGECVGVRSFPGTGHAGQTAGWRGDLNDWQDYFFFPDLGEEKPRKGRSVPFGFNRGERYSIEVRWDGHELLLVVDSETILRKRSGKVKGKCCELKTLKDARIDSLTIEGHFRGN